MFCSKRKCNIVVLHCLKSMLSVIGMLHLHCVCTTSYDKWPYLFILFLSWFSDIFLRTYFPNHNCLKDNLIKISPGGLLGRRTEYGRIQFFLFWKSFTKKLFEHGPFDKKAPKGPRTGSRLMSRRARANHVANHNIAMWHHQKCSSFSKYCLLWFFLDVLLPL